MTERVWEAATNTFTFPVIQLAPYSPSAAGIASSPPVRPISWRTYDGTIQRKPLSKESRASSRDAAINQTRGVVAAEECLHCADGFGPFTECVVATASDGRTVGQGACANCLWGGKTNRCSFR